MKTFTYNELKNRNLSVYTQYSFKKMNQFCGPLAQLVEQFPFKEWVDGSSPSRLTIKLIFFKSILLVDNPKLFHSSSYLDFLFYFQMKGEYS